VTLQKLLFVIFESCLNTNPQQSRHQSPRQMSPDIITSHYFSNPLYCTVNLLQKWNKGKNGNTSKLTKSSNYLYKCDIFSKIISKNALIIACTVDLSFKTNWHKIYWITQHQARQQIPEQIVDFSKIRAILNRYGLILYQVNISRNKTKLMNVWPHQVNKNSQIINCNQTIIICKTWTTIFQTNKDLTTLVFVLLCIDWTQCNIRRKASVSTQNSYCHHTRNHTVSLSCEIKGRMCKFTISETIHNTTTIP